MKQVCKHCGMCYGHKCPKCGERGNFIVAAHASYECRDCGFQWSADDEPEIRGTCINCIGMICEGKQP